MGDGRPMSSIIPTGKDPKQSWIFIRNRLYRPFSVYTVRETTEYMECYSAMGNLFKRGRSRGRPHVAQKLYSTIQTFLHIALQNGRSSISSSAGSSSSSNVLTNYVTAWEQFLLGANYNSHVLSHMNRLWVARQQAEGVKDVWPVITVHFLAWKRVVFDSLKGELVDAMMAEGDSAVLKSAEQSYEVLKRGLDGTGESMEDFELLLSG